MLRFQPFSLRVAACFALGRVAFRQILSEPVVVLLVLFAHMASLLAPLFQFQRFGEEGRLAREGALAAMLIAGLPLAFFAVAGTMGKEQRSGLAAMLFSKPVGSLDFCLSKVFAAVTVVVWWGWNQGCILLLSTASAPREVLASSGETLYTINRVAFLCGLAGIVLPLVAAALSNRWREKDFCLTFSADFDAWHWGGLLGGMSHRVAFNSCCIADSVASNWGSLVDGFGLFLSVWRRGSVPLFGMVDNGAFVRGDFPDCHN